MKKHYRKENDCLNCGTILEGKFCHNCGQENLELHESFGHIINHAVSDYFHFDQQFFRTLKPLLFKPGFLTNEYMAGRRVQYLHPVKMYIFISVIYFLLMFQIGGHNNIIKIDDKPTASLTAVDTNLKVKPVNKVSPPLPKRNIESIDADTTYEQYLASQQKLPADKRDGFWARLFSKKVFSYKEKYGKKASTVFVEEVEHNMPKMMFVLLPLFALILKVTFRKNHKFYVEHLIYSIHFHCFLFLFISVALLLSAVIPANWTSVTSLLGLAEFVIVILYFYKSLKAVYHRSTFLTITKIIAISIAYWVTGFICIMGVAIITGLVSG